MFYPITNSRRWIFGFDRWLCSPAYSADSTISGSWKLLWRGQISTCWNTNYKPKDNLPNTEQRALESLQEDPNINLKADKATQTVVLNTKDKILEGQIHLDNLEQYKPLERPMVVETSPRVQQLVK